MGPPPRHRYIPSSREVWSLRQCHPWGGPDTLTSIGSLPLWHPYSRKSKWVVAPVMPILVRILTVRLACPIRIDQYGGRPNHILWSVFAPLASIDAHSAPLARPRPPATPVVPSGGAVDVREHAGKKTGDLRLPSGPPSLRRKKKGPESGPNGAGRTQDDATGRADASGGGVRVMGACWLFTV